MVHVSAVWSIKVPPRVHMFLWLLVNKRVLAGDNLAKRRKVKDESCLFCNEREVNTCFLIVQLLKGVISEILGVAVGDIN